MITYIIKSKTKTKNEEGESHLIYNVLFNKQNEFSASNNFKQKKIFGYQTK